MASKVTVFLFVTFLAGSALANPLLLPSNQNPLRKVKNAAIDNLIEIAEKIILGLNRLITEVLNEVGGGIESMLKALQYIGEYSVKFAEQVIDKEVEILNALIERVKNQTSGERYDILQCIEDTENEAVLVRDQAINMSYICINSAIQQAGLDAEKLVLDIRDWEEDLRQEEQKLENCKNSTEAVICVRDVINRLVDIAVTFPERIEADNDKAQAEFDHLGEVMQQCVSNSQSYVQRENEKVKNDFNQCVSERQNGTFTTASAQ